ncbi:MAG: hypothetical protein WCX77_02890 [Candidatus Paceibacterota bacterium]|jgi:hypothetical protein
MSSVKKISIAILASVIVLSAIGFGYWKLNQLKTVKEGAETAPATTSEEKTPIKVVAGGAGYQKVPCLILDEKYCNGGTPIYNEQKDFIGLGFNLPKGTKIYSPFDGTIDNDIVTQKMSSGLYYGFEISETCNSGEGKDQQRNFFSVFGDIKTIKSDKPYFPENPNRLVSDPVQKQQIVAETLGKSKITTPDGNYDIVIDFTALDLNKNILSQKIEYLEQFFPYLKNDITK